MMATLVSECFVKPKYEVEVSKKPYYLGNNDLILLSTHYMQKGLLFTKPTSFNTNDLNSFLHKLKISLSLALVEFYPLAGRMATIKYEDEHRCLIYVDCQKGPGARFIHAKTDKATVTDVILSAPDVIPVIRSFFDLGEAGVINHDGHKRALLSVQLTELVDGLFVGFTMNHSVADGTSLWHFISTLSELHTELIITHTPIYNKRRLSSGIIKLPYLNPDEFITRPDVSVQTREIIFHFSKASMTRLKAEANAETCSSDADVGSLTISTFQSLCALLWKSITRARDLPSEEETTCTLIVNSRPRLNPPLSQNYFGTYGLIAKGRCKVEELLGNGLGPTALLLHQAVAAQDDKAARRALEAYTAAPFVAHPSWAPSIYGSHPLLIGGSARFDMYGPEFGLGRAVAVRTGYANKRDGKVTASPGCEGAGSVDLEVCLEAETMTNLLLDQQFMSYATTTTM